jgi:hypothetical protein
VGDNKGWTTGKNCELLVTVFRSIDHLKRKHVELGVHAKHPIFTNESKNRVTLVAK